MAPQQGPADDAAAALARGVTRLLSRMEFACLSEFSLRSGRRADIAALNGKGRLLIVEIKSSLADFRADSKWLDYEAYCDAFYFAVAPHFPVDVLPEDRGLILADRFDAEIVRPADEDRVRMSGARRSEITRRFALTAARRLMTISQETDLQRARSAPHPH